ncbi:hypothetical protein M3Y97_00134400 [Aphelenchoides bicaudatus]|nr:hypothetical protein M3Y97_00134400 [Aphelenchoides bicaudatus]
MSYYNQGPQNPQYAPQGANPGYGWNPTPQPNQQNPGGTYQSVPAFQGNPKLHGRRHTEVRLEL